MEESGMIIREYMKEDVEDGSIDVKKER